MSLEQQLIERLQTLAPSHLEVINESAGHGGYFPGKESHFKVIVVRKNLTACVWFNVIKKFMPWLLI